MKICSLFGLIGLTNLIPNLFRPISIQGRKVSVRDFVKEFNIGLYLNIYGPIPFKRGMMIETTELYILIPVWMTVVSFKVTVVVKTSAFIS